MSSWPPNQSSVTFHGFQALIEQLGPGEPVLDRRIDGLDGGFADREVVGQLFGR